MNLLSAPLLIQSFKPPARYCSVLSYGQGLKPGAIENINWLAPNRKIMKAFVSDAPVRVPPTRCNEDACSLLFAPTFRLGVMAAQVLGFSPGSDKNYGQF